MKSLRQLAITLAVSVFGVLGAMSAALAQSPYPTKPVRLIIPFGPGTTSDIIGRLIGDRLAAAMGQPFLAENRTGAGGTIGNEAVAKAAADGYTLLVLTAAFPVAAAVYPNLRYDAVNDFAAITVFSTSPLALAANLEFPAKTVPELIAYAKANPRRVAFGSLGIGTSHHLTGEKLKVDAGIDMVHVPYKGSSAAHVDLMGGQIQVMFDNIVALMPHFKSGRLRPLAVSSLKRHPLLPDVPSLAEQGVKDFEAVAWFGLAAPAATPRDIVGRLNAEAVKALAIPDVRQRLVDAGSEIVGNAPEAADRFMRAELERWSKVARAANVKAD